MKKFWLTFKDERLEAQYQQSILHYQRDSVFKFASYSILIVVAIKIIVFALQWNTGKLISSIVVFAYLFLQYQIVRRKAKYLRLAAVILNHVAQIYQIWDNQTDPQMAMLQGINTMAFTTIVVLVGEYIDGIITIINLTIYRLIWVTYFSKQINWSIMFGQIFLIFFINYFNYQFHRGRRSSFLLTLVDSCSKSIYYKLAKDKPFLIIQYEEERLQFEVLSENNCSQIYGKDSSFQDFFRKVTIEKRLLSTYLQEQYNIFLHNSNYQNKGVILNYDRNKIKADISIFSSKQPQILIIFEQIDSRRKLQLNISNKAQQLITFSMKATRLITKLSKFQSNYQQIKFQFQQIRRKLFIMFLLENFHKERKSIKISIQNLKEVMKAFCSSYKLNIQIEKEITFETFPLSLYLCLLIVFDNSQQVINIDLNWKEDQNFEILLKGKFDKCEINSLSSQFNDRLQIIFQSFLITDRLIYMKFNHEMNIPYQLLY